MASQDNHEAHDYVERIRERLTRRLQELREAAHLSKYALEKKSGVSREMISCIEGGESNPLYPRASGGAGAIGAKRRWTERSEVKRIEKAIPYQSKSTWTIGSIRSIRSIN